MPETTGSDGTQIHYERVGEGTPIILLHGFAMGLERWRGAGYIGTLVPHYSVIAIDARGHGSSGKPHDRSAYTPDLMTGDVLAVLDAEGVQAAHFWGYSMGGRILRNLYERVPDRVATAITGGSAPTEPVVGDPPDPQITALRSGIEAFVELMDPGGTGLTPQAREFFLSNDAAALAEVRAAQRTWPKSAPRLECPALLYAGGADGVHDATKAYANELGAAFHTIPGANHGMAFGISAPVLPLVLEFLKATS